MKNGYQDQQMDTIKHLLKPHVSDIIRADNEQVALVFKMYEIILEFLNDIVDIGTLKPHNKVALIGGIQINCEGNKTDVFYPMIFEIR